MAHRPTGRHRDLSSSADQTILNGWQSGSGKAAWAGQLQPFLDPYLTYRDRLTLSEGSRRVEIFWGPAETDDATAVWLPDERLLYGGAATIASIPNVGTPLRTYRDAVRWADTLDARETPEVRAAREMKQEIATELAG